MTAAWADALDQLEADLSRYEALAEATNAPSGLPRRPYLPEDIDGPLPDDLVDRARALLAHMVSVEHRMADALLVRRIELDNQPIRVPRYIDSAL